MPEFLPSSDLPKQKRERYAVIAPEIAAVLEDELNLTARMASIAAMLAQSFETFLWTGFYVVDPNDPEMLVVGPYQGRLGCLRIALGKGVCGHAAASRRTVVVPDVEAFPGHIVCDSRARSEIVVPVFGPDEELIGVLDIDSAEPAAFDQVDALELEAILRQAFASSEAVTDDRAHGS